MEPIRSHDALFRFVFGEPEQMAELLRTALPAAVAAEIAWSSLTRVEGTFVDKALQGRHTDLLFTAHAGAEPVLLYVVAEHKSWPDPRTALQLAGYVVRVLDRWVEANPRGRSLPAVLPFVLHHGDRPWNVARSPHELVDLRGCPVGTRRWFGRHQLRMPFVLLDLAGVDEARIDAMRLSAVGSLALRFLQLLRHCPPELAATSILRWQHLVTRLLAHPRGKEVLFSLLSWFLAAAPASHETLRTVMSKIEQDAVPMRSCLDLLLEMNEERGVQKGLERGLEQGIEQGLTAMRSLLEFQLGARFGPLPANVVARLAAADAAALQTWGRRLFAAATVEQVFAAD